MNNIHFIAGASGSGKSAIAEDLKQILGDNFVVFDFDDIGAPDNADKKWRQEATEQWIQKILQEKKDVLLLGQIVLGEILACPSASKMNKIHFCLLDVSDAERVKRLKKRNTYGMEQDTLNWAAWLRMHHQDPQWEPHVIQNDSWPQLNFNRWSKLDKWNSLAHVNSIDTTGLSIAQVASAVKNWIDSNEKS